MRLTLLRTILLGILDVAAGAVGGCAAPAPLPTHAAMSDEAALRVIADRLESVRTISARCEVALTDAGGETVRLDGALAAAPPNRLRLRAWKFDQAVFDLTVVDGRTWLMTHEDASLGGGAMGPAARVPAERIGQVFTLLGPEYFRSARPAPGESSARTLIVTAPAPALGGEVVRCEIDRATLTPRRMTAAGVGVGGRGAAPSLELDRYRMISGIPWPTVIRVRGSGREEVAVGLAEVELNAPLPEGAFTPPRRAVQQGQP